MVERVWSARAKDRADAAAYAAHFQRVVIPELNAVAGYHGARLLQRDVPAGVEIVVVTTWESLDVVRGFAGDDIEQAVVHDEAAALFSDYDRTVRHFEIVSDDKSASSKLRT
jgi:heme-degrading monooxygenase HmoA